jgi:hypothetical protein
MRWEEYPPALQVVRAVAGALLFLVILGLGIDAVAVGSTTGRIVGGVLIVSCVAVAVRVIRWRSRGEIARPS